MINKLKVLWAFAQRLEHDASNAPMPTPQAFYGTEDNLHGIRVEAVRNGYLLVYQEVVRTPSSAKGHITTTREYAPDPKALADLMIARCVQQKLEQL